jgi:hypothetical protein
MMNMSRQQLEARFQPVKDVREETLWGGVSTIHLTLVPKGNAGYKYAEVWIDPAGLVAHPAKDRRKQRLGALLRLFARHAKLIGKGVEAARGQQFVEVHG